MASCTNGLQARCAALASAAAGQLPTRLGMHMVSLSTANLLRHMLSLLAKRVLRLGEAPAMRLLAAGSLFLRTQPQLAAMALAQRSLPAAEAAANGELDLSCCGMFVLVDVFIRLQAAPAGVCAAAAASSLKPLQYGCGCCRWRAWLASLPPTLVPPTCPPTSSSACTNCWAALPGPARRGSRARGGAACTAAAGGQLP